MKSILLIAFLTIVAISPKAIEAQEINGIGQFKIGAPIADLISDRKLYKLVVNPGKKAKDEIKSTSDIPYSEKKYAVLIDTSVKRTNRPTPSMSPDPYLFNKISGASVYYLSGVEIAGIESYSAFIGAVDGKLVFLNLDMPPAKLIDALKDKYTPNVAISKTDTFACRYVYTGASQSVTVPHDTVIWKNELTYIEYVKDAKMGSNCSFTEAKIYLMMMDKSCYQLRLNSILDEEKSKKRLAAEREAALKNSL